MNTSVTDMADLVVRELKAAGFTIQRYDSYSTNSVYLKLDYGVCNSIRISDHKGKKHLRYRYNLISSRKGKNSHDNSGFPRHYYSFVHVYSMVFDILDARSEKILHYGPAKYKQFMNHNKAANQHRKGFWEQCYVVH